MLFQENFPSNPVLCVMNFADVSQPLAIARQRGWPLCCRPHIWPWVYLVLYEGSTKLIQIVESSTSL